MDGTRIQFLNHSSVLIRHGKSFILTDPWFERPAFGSWLPTPAMAIHPSYLTALAGKSDEFAILVSHGHDDHCDDDLLSQFDPNTLVVIASFASPGLKKRIERTGLRRIVEVGETPTPVFGYVVRAFINRDISLDDALFLVETPHAVVVHANDCWQEPTPTAMQTVRAATGAKGPARSLYMCQTNIADGYPLVYSQYSDEERALTRRRRLDRIIRTALENCAKAGCRHFLSYAGHATVHVRPRPDFLRSTGPPTIEHVRSLVPEEYRAMVDVLDCNPGDTFDFEKVTSWLGGDVVDTQSLKDAATRFYHATGRVEACDTFTPRQGRERTLMSDAERLESLERFLSGFSDFVASRAEQRKYRQTIIDQVVAFRDRKTGVTKAVRVGTGLVSADEVGPEGIHTAFIVDEDILSDVLRGTINAENLYIGYESEILLPTPDFYNADIIRWLSMYAYYYQNQARAGATT